MFVQGSEFGRVGIDAKNALMKALSCSTYGNNEVVYLQDDDAGHLYFVASGHIRLSYIMEDGSAILYAILPPGDSFGELGVFEGGLRCDMATGIGDSVVASISSKRFRALCSEYPDLSHALAQLVARRYRSYIDLTRIMSLKTLPARVAQALLRVADMLGTRTSHDGADVPQVGPVVTQADLGLMARGARGNVNRALKDWQRSGWITIKNRSILILNRNALEALAFEEDL